MFGRLQFCGYTILAARWLICISWLCRSLVVNNVDYRVVIFLVHVFTFHSLGFLSPLRRNWTPSHLFAAIKPLMFFSTTKCNLCKTSTLRQIPSLCKCNFLQTTSQQEPLITPNTGARPGASGSFWTLIPLCIFSGPYSSMAEWLGEQRRQPPPLPMAFDS